MEAAVGDLGLTRLRLEAVGNEIEPEDDDYTWGGWVADGSFRAGGWDAYVSDWVVPFHRRVEAQGDDFALNVCYVGFRAATAFHTDPAEYAEFVSAVLQRLRARWGIEPDVWEVVLEPDGGPADIPRSGVEVGRMLAAAATRAREEGFGNVGFAAPSVSFLQNFGEYFDEATTQPGVRGALVEAVYHRYGRNSREGLRGVRDRARRLGVRSAMLERIGADHEDLHEDLTLADVSAWQQFTLAYPGDDADCGGAYYVIDARRSRFRPARCVRYLRQYFRYVRPGAVRIAARSTHPEDVRPVAFRNRGGDVAVVVNAGRRSGFTVAGLPAGTYRITYATEDEARGDGGTRTVTAGDVVEVSIPDEGVITLSR